MQLKNILVISSVTEIDNNGLAVVFKPFIKYLRDSGFQFNLVYFKHCNLPEVKSVEDQKIIILKPLSKFEILSSFFYRNDSYYSNKFYDYLNPKSINSTIIFFGSTYDPIIDYLSIKLNRKVFVHCNDSIYLFESRRTAYFNNVFRKCLSKYIERKRLLNDNLTLIYVGKRDLDFANILSSKENSFFLPLGVDCDKFTPGKYNRTEKKIILFTGDLRYQPNIEAVELLVKSILPKLHKDYVLHIVGRSPSNELFNLCNVNRVFLLPDVVDINLEYQKAFLFVAPMFSGAGMKNKILEALSCAIPVITTNIEKYSFKSIPDGVIFCVSVSDIVNEINSLLENTMLWEKLSKEARLHVKENYSWELRNRNLFEILQSN